MIFREITYHTVGELFVVRTWLSSDNLFCRITVEGQECEFETERFNYTFDNFTRQSLLCTDFIIGKLEAAFADIRQVVDNITRNHQRGEHAVLAASPPSQS